MRVALVHDWLTGMRGGEKCLEAFLDLYPEADIFTLIHIPGATSTRIDARVRGTSFLNRLPGVSKYYRALLPLFPCAARSLKLRGYDLVVSLSHAAAKNVQLSPNTRHICFCFTPMRYIWDQAQSYLGVWRYPTWPLLAWLRSWDRRGAMGVSEFVAISKFVAARIRLFYGRRAQVLYPALEAHWLEGELSTEPRQDFFLYAGALVPYKNVDKIVLAFNRLGLRLVVAGAGPEESRLKGLAAANIEFRHRPNDAELKALYSQARALVFAATEDFGLVPLEALACGTPVVAHHSGALRETLRGYLAENSKQSASRLESEPRGGVFFRSQTPESIAKGVEAFIVRESSFSREGCRELARRFSPTHFVRRWAEIVGV